MSSMKMRRDKRGATDSPGALTRGRSGALAPVGNGAAGVARTERMQSPAGGAGGTASLAARCAGAARAGTDAWMEIDAATPSKQMPAARRDEPAQVANRENIPVRSVIAIPVSALCGKSPMTQMGEQAEAEGRKDAGNGKNRGKPGWARKLTLEPHACILWLLKK